MKKLYLMFKPEAAHATRCPRCGAAVGERCRGAPDEYSPHRERRKQLFEERRAKPVTRTLPGRTYHT